MPPSSPLLMLVSDASGSWGCGAVHQNLWLQVQWPKHWETVSIAPKELVPIVMESTLWGPYWAGRHAQCLCDNMAVVAAVNKEASIDPILAHLLRILAFAAVVLDLRVTARHLPGVQNISADALSCNNLHLFFSLNPQVSPAPHIIPPELQQLVFSQNLYWTSPSWMALLSTSWITALHLPHAQHTDRPSAGTSPSA